MSEIQSTVEETGTILRTLKVTVSADRVKAGFDRAYRKLQGQAQLKGFRKGKAPRALLEQAYGGEVTRDVLSDLVEEGCGQSIREHGLDVVAQPRLLKQEYAGEGDLVFEVSVDIRPDVRLGQYKGLEVEMLIPKVDEAGVTAALDGLRNRMAVLRTETERTAVKEGDVVVFRMAGFEGDAAVPGTSGEGLVLEVGSGRFPEDFEKQLVGVERDRTSPITVSFSEDHGDDSVRGKTIRFDVTVTEIKEKVLPPLDDSLAAEAGVEGVETLDALREKIREDLVARARREAERRARNAVVGKLVEAHEFEVPQSLLHEAIHSYMHEMGAEGLSHDSDESRQLHEALAPRARAELRAGFLLDAVAVAESLEVSREEMENRIRAQMASAGNRVEEVRRHYSRPEAIADLRRGLTREKAAQCVYEHASVQEREVDETQVADQQGSR